MANDTPNVPPTAPAAPVVTAVTVERPEKEIVIYQHSNILYWWPVWFFGFLFAAVTYFGDYHMAIVPAGTVAKREAQVIDRQGGDMGARDVLVLAKGKTHPTFKGAAGTEEIVQPTIFMTRYRSLGTVFLFVLLIVIFITNITLRGQWSLILLVILSSLVIIFWLAGFWDEIFERLGNLSIFINLGGYIMIAVVVFALWMVNFYFFDRQIYVIFTPGNVRLQLELGAGENIYSTFGMVVQKKRSDIFRHRILGFGSGDLVIQFPRVDHPIELHNILRIDSVLRQIEDIANSREVVTTTSVKPGPTPPANGS